MPTPLLLALDTASPYVTVAVHDGTRALAEVRGDEPLRHGEQLAPAVQRALADAGAAPRDLTGVAVGRGPGPYTGLRVGLVTARTMAAVLEVPVHGVCSLDVLAVRALDDGVGEPFVVASDARRREVYWAAYDATGPGGGVVRTRGPEVARPADLDEEVRRRPVVGEGARLHPVELPGGRTPELPDAADLAAAVLAGRVEVADPAPMYLRRPDVAAPKPPKRVG